MSGYMLFLIAISLSMDAFSVAIGLGSNYRNNNFVFPITVGIFHFILPLLGSVIAIQINKLFLFNENKILAVVFIILAFEMIIDLFSKDDKKTYISKIQTIILAFSVSLDSLLLGIGLYSLQNLLFCSFIFATFSFCFSLIGLLIGRFTYENFGFFAKIVGILIIVILACIHICK